MTSLLVTLADKNYIDQAKQLFSSVYFNAGWAGDYMLLAHEIPKSELKWFRDKGILVKECLPLYEGRLASGYPVTILDKFYLFTPEFKKWNNVIFLDADIIVRYSFEKLTKLKGFNAVLDFGNPLLKDQFNKTTSKSYLRDEISKNFNINSSAFNTGVMAFNTQIIKEGSLKSLLTLFSKYESICKYGEQPIINLYFYKKWKKLNFLYNTSFLYFTQHYHLNRNKINSIIIHFMSSDKPWYITNPFYDEWKNNLDKSNMIDLKNRKIENIKILNKNKILYLNLNFNIIKIYFDLYYFTDRLIGLTGIYLKNKYPKFYNYLLKLKK